MSYLCSMNSVTIKKLINIFAEVYDVKVKWIKIKGEALGWFKVTPTGKVFMEINEYYPSRYWLSTFFHELGHIWCYRNDVFKCYHNPKRRNGKLTRRARRNKVLTGWKAECFVDRWGCWEQAKWFPELYYYFGYVGQKGAKEWLHENHLNKYKD